MYARMNRCYNEQGSGTKYVCSSIPHYIYSIWLKLYSHGTGSQRKDMSALHKRPATLLILQNSVFDMFTHAYGKIIFWIVWIGFMRTGVVYIAL